MFYKVFIYWWFLARFKLVGLLGNERMFDSYGANDIILALDDRFAGKAKLPFDVGLARKA